MALTVDASETALSSRRSASRCRVLVTLADRGGVMGVNELADAAGMTPGRLRAVVFGDDHDFSVRRAPFTLGQLALHHTPQGEMLVLTPEGAREVELLRLEPFWARGRDRGPNG